MAVPASFDGADTVLDKPADMSYEECGVLAVRRGAIQDQPVVLSCWKLTPEELAEIIKTGRVWLLVLGYTMPPVEVCGIDPSLDLEAR